MIASTIAAWVTITLTAYAPACGGINGSLRSHYADMSSRPLTEHHLDVAACGRQWPLGTVLEVRGAEQHGVTRVVCRDRGSVVTGVDVLVLTGEGCAVDRKMAMAIGRRRVEVREIVEVTDVD